jgi:EAL and modified HD-GYP domain-containing signal transduction protein
MATTVFLGRQPIFDRRRQVFGYELLHRSSAGHNAFDHSDGNAASRQVINNSLNVMAWRDLVGDRRGFINFTRQLLLEGTYAVLPADRSVVELLEDTGVDEPVLAACRNLKQAGYMLALDDFVFKPECRPLLELADMLKIDFMASDEQQRAWHAQRFGGGRLMLLAEKVETPADFEQALKLGYSHFQGYFFCKPEIVEGRDVPADKRNYLRFLQEVNRPEMDLDRLEDVIKHEVSLSAKLLRYLNSAAVGLRYKLTSIKQALVLLGQGPLRKWASLVATSALGEDKAPELLVTCLARARFCELLAAEAGLAGRELDLFLMGLFSALDALMDQPLEMLISQIPVPEDVSSALLGADTLLGRTCRLVLAFERGNVGLVESAGRDLNLSLEQLSERYRQAVHWADQVRV